MKTTLLFILGFLLVGCAGSSKYTRIQSMEDFMAQENVNSNLVITKNGSVLNVQVEDVHEMKRRLENENADLKRKLDEKQAEPKKVEQPRVVEQQQQIAEPVAAEPVAAEPVAEVPEMPKNLPSRLPAQVKAPAMSDADARAIMDDPEATEEMRTKATSALVNNVNTSFGYGR